MTRSYIETSALNYYIVQILCIVRGESDEDSCMVLQLSGTIIRYNLKDRSFKKLSDNDPAVWHIRMTCLVLVVYLG
ncbi:conserved hypothetical protein [Ricinus communis]|uniref:Uncharacterized protein n=1 Tax=Ricinus communis TaxID=3988 RepID=B9R9X3_RICCO|nr:conserved hypothetical protein [Ricinus communis]